MPGKKIDPEIKELVEKLVSEKLSKEKKNSSAENLSVEAKGRTIIRNIRNEREKRGLTQAQFASLCGLSEKYISSLEREIYSPALKTVLMCSEVLDVPLYKLAEESTGKKSDAIPLLITKIESLSIEEQKKVLAILNIIY